MHALPTQAVTHALERGYPAEVLVWACQLLMQLHYAAGMGAYVEDPPCNSLPPSLQLIVV